MIAYKIQIVIDEEHEEKFEDITEDIYNHIERIDGITEVHGDPESYFEYNEDINFEEEEDDKTDEEIVAIIKGNETAVFSLMGLGQQAMPTSRLKFLVDAWEPRKAKKVVVVKQPPYHYPTEHYFCECGKQQKHTLKNRIDGCYCERCGQKLVWGDAE